MVTEQWKKLIFHVNRSMFFLHYFLVIMSHISARQSTLMFNSSLHNKRKCDIAASLFKSQQHALR